LPATTRFTAEHAEDPEEGKIRVCGFNPESGSRVFSAFSARSAVRSVGDKPRRYEPEDPP